MFFSFYFLFLFLFWFCFVLFLSFHSSDAEITGFIRRLKKKKKEIEKEREGTWLTLGIVVEKVFYRYVGKHSQRQEHLENSREDMTLSFVRRWQRGRERGES